MSRFWILAPACAFALTLTATPAIAQTADQIKEVFGQPQPDVPSAVLLKTLNRKVDFDGNKIGEMTLTDVLQKLASKHDITFVILDKKFKARKIDIKARKSHLKQIDAKGMTVAKFLDVWLLSVGATYKVCADYVEIVPLPLKVIASP